MSNFIIPSNISKKAIHIYTGLLIGDDAEQMIEKKNNTNYAI